MKNGRKLNCLLWRINRKKTFLFFYFAFLLVQTLFCLTGCKSSDPSYIILCAGNSLTKQGYPPYLGRLLRQRGLRTKIYNFGRSGHNSREYLIYLKNNEATLKTLQPDFILLELGTNDVRLDGDSTSLDSFEKNMAEIIRIFSTFKTRPGDKTQVIIGLIPPVPDGAQYPFSSESALRIENEINPTLLKLAKKNNLPVADHWRLFKEKPELLPDVHPTPEGYREMAKAWLEVLLPYLHNRRPIKEQN